MLDTLKITLLAIVLHLVACTPKVGTTVDQGSKETQEETPRMIEAPRAEMDDVAAAPQKAMPDGAPSDPMLQPLPIDQRVKMGSLPNGMKYYIQHNTKPENRAELRLAVAAGSINEDDDQLGLAHFVEHMAFNGTANFNKSELVDYLQSVGTRFGPDLNAYTSFDETVYMLQVRTDSQAIFDKGMLILEDWAHSVTFEDEEIDKERGVVESELRSGLSADERMRNEYLPVIFHESKYADRLPIGTREIINNAPYDALKRFYRDWYRPNLMALVVVGDVDVDAVEKQILERFAKLENPENPRERERYGFPDHDNTLVSITQDKEATYTTARVMYKHDHEKVKNFKDYRQSLVRSLYNSMLNNRLNELRQSANPPFLYGYAGYGREVGELDSYTLYVTTGEGEVLKGLEAVFTENKRALEHGFTATELDRTRIEILSQAETTAKEEDKLQSGSLAMSYVYHYLNESPALSPTQRFQIMQALLPTITLDEVNHLADKWINEDGSNRVIVVTGPEKEQVPLPSEDDIYALISKVGAKTVDPYEDAVSDVPLMVDMPEMGAVTEEKVVEDVGITEWTLSNGVRVILKPTDFQNDEIMFTAFSPGGHSNYPDEEYQSASIASAIINQAGIADFDLIQLQKMMAGKQVQVAPFISELEEGMQGFSTIKDLETMFQLIHLYFTEPREDAEAFQSMITRQRQILQNLRANPDYFYRDKVNEVRYKNHPRRGIPTVDDLDEMNLETVMKVYKDRFADASDFTFIFVGNFTSESIKPFITKYLASLPSTGREDQWKDVGVEVTKGRNIERFNFGEAPKAQIEMHWIGEFDWDDREAKYHLNSLMEVLRNKLRESMREDQGGVYGVSISGNTSKYPKEGYSVRVSFNSEPEEVDALIETAIKDIEDVMENGATEEELTKVREVQRQGRIKGLEENRFWTNALRSTYMYDQDPHNILLENYEELIDDLDSDDIKMMAKQLFDTDNYTEIVMLPGSEND